MPFLVRKISRAKWDQKINSDIAGDISADAITSCLRTTSNELSVWVIDSEADLDNALLALITNSKQEKLAKLDYALIEEKLLLEAGLSLNKTPGDTVVPHLINTHMDIIELTYTKMGTVKDLMLPYINTTDTNFRSRQQLKVLIQKAITAGTLNKNDLHPKLINSEGL